jgi:hypothetical protein
MASEQMGKTHSDKKFVTSQKCCRVSATQQRCTAWQSAAGAACQEKTPAEGLPGFGATASAAGGSLGSAPS